MLLDKLGKVVLRVPEELEVLWLVFDLFPGLSSLWMEKKCIHVLKASSLINFTEKAVVPLKIIYLHGIWRIVSIPPYLNGLVVSGCEKGKGKKFKMEIKYEMKF